MVNNVTIDICGGLGNQLFQIAAVLYYSELYKHKVVFPNYTQLANNWNEYRGTYWNTLFANCFDIIDARIIHNYQKFVEYRYSFQELPFYDTNVCLQGYFQSPRYIDPIANTIKKYLYSNAEIMKVVEWEYNKIVEQYGSELISIHVRRGDYLQISDIHTNLTDEYYKNAINLISDTLPVVVFSNDIAYCKSHFPEVVKNPLIFVERLDDFVELFLMSRIKNNVVANSSFSWWAAYLNENSDKRVIAPKNWFAHKGPQDYHELYCEGWEVI